MTRVVPSIQRLEVGLLSHLLPPAYSIRAPMDCFSGIKIEKLCGDSFHVWKQKVELVLALKNLDDHLDIAKPIDEDKISKLKKHDVNDRAIIGFTLSKEHLDNMRDIDPAGDMWKAILMFSSVRLCSTGSMLEGRSTLPGCMVRGNFYSS